MRKFITLVSLVLVFAVLVLTACSNGENISPPEVKKAKDHLGNEYSAVVGEDGFLSLGDRAGLAVSVTDENGNPGKNAKGEYVTKSVEFPYTLTVDDEIHTRFLKLKIPEGWKNISDELVKIEYKKDGLSAQIMLNKRLGDTYSCKLEIEDLMSGFAEVKESKTEFSFGEAIKLEYENISTFYIFMVEKRTYFVRVNADKELKGEIDFEEIINTIKFREGE